MTDILENTNAFTEPCFSLRNRLLRVLWRVVYIAMFRFTPRPLHAWRVFILRCFGARIGRSCHIYPGASVWAPWNLTMGDHSCFANDVLCYSMAKITVGSRAVVSQGTKLITGTHDHSDPGFRLVARDINIGNDVWLASDVFVCPGVTIASGAVVGARSVVTRDVPGWKISAGNPCRPVKDRRMKGEKKDA